MRYADDNEAKLGDHVTIDGQYKGVVVADIDGGKYSERCPEAQWKSLGSGIVVDTDFGGLVHYQTAKSDRIVLARRSS